MKVYKRDDYNIKEYKKEVYRIEIFDKDKNLYTSETTNDLIKAMMIAKHHASGNKEVEIWELKYQYNV